VFLLNLLKSNSRELLMIDIVLARYSSSPTIYGAGVIHLNVPVPQYRIVTHLKLKFQKEYIKYLFMKFSYSKI